MLLFTFNAKAQVPIAYYDFEDNSTHNTLLTTIDQDCAGGMSSPVTIVLASAGANTVGAGVAHGGSGQGRAISAYPGVAMGSSDPTTTATRYYQFSVTTKDFSGIKLQFDEYPSTPNAPYYGVSINNGSGWTWVGSNSTPGAGNSMPWSFNNWGTAFLNLPASADNATTLTVRIYFYWCGGNSADILKLDNLQIQATTQSASATMLDFGSIYTETTSGGTGSMYVYPNYTISGASTVCTLQNTSGGGLFLSGTLSLAGGQLVLPSVNGYLSLLLMGSCAINTTAGGSIKGNSNATIRLYRTIGGNIGTIAFTTGYQTLQNLQIQSNGAAATTTLGSNLTLTGNTPGVGGLMFASSSAHSLDLNGNTLTLGSGAAGRIDMAMYAVPNSIMSTAVGGKVIVTSSGAAVGLTSGTSTFSIGNNTTMEVSGQMNFGNNLTTFANGSTLQMNCGGSVINYAPIYASGSLLKYSGGCTVGRSLEWSSMSGAGYPGNVQLCNNVTLDLGNGGASTARQNSGNFTIDLGSSLTTNNSPNQMTAQLTVLGNVINNGTITLSALAGGDLTISGSYTNNGTFTANGRTVSFNATSTGKTLAGTLTGATGQFYNVSFTGTGGGWTFSNNCDIANHCTISAGTVTAPSVLNISGNFSCNGTFNHNSGTVNFIGNNYATISGTSTCTFNHLTCNKGTTAVTKLEATGTGGGAVSCVGTLTLTNGIYKLTGSNCTAQFNYAATIPATAGLWIAGGTLIGSNNMLWNNGVIRVSAGTCNFGTVAGNNFVNVAGIFNCSGGTVNHVGCHGNFGTDSISGGTVNIATVAQNHSDYTFKQTAASNFRMTGGTIVLQNANAGTGGDLYMVAGGSKLISGGTFQIGNASTPVSQIFKINTNVPVYHFMVNNVNSPVARLTGNPLDANGNISIMGASTLDAWTNLMNVNIAGNFVNNGTFMDNSTTFVMDGSIPQTISGTSATSFYNLKIQNTNGGVTLQNHVTVTGTLTMTTGIVTTGAYRLHISNTAAGACVAGPGNTNYLNSYINGNCRRSIVPNTGVYDFPVGSATRSNLFRCANHNISGPTYFDYRIDPKAGTDAGLNVIDGGSVCSSMSSEGEWTFNPDVAIASGSFDVSLFFSGFAGMVDDQQTVCRRNIGNTSGSGWSCPSGTTRPTNGTPGMIVSAGFIQRFGFTIHGMFDIGHFNTALPVQLLSFDAAVIDNSSVLLKWATASELNSDIFDIERSDDGEKFEKIGTINAAGFSQSYLDYKFTDENPLTGVSYYRLKEVDIDGTTEYSDIRSVNIEDNMAVNVFPNPATDHLNIEITNTEDDGPVTVSIIDMTGRVIAEQTSSGSFSESMQFNLMDLAIGTYVVRVNSKKKEKKFKVVKLH